MAKPTVDTRWCTNQVAIAVPDIEGGGSALVLNRLEGTNTLKDIGYQPLVPMTGGSLNYKLYADHVMIEWLRNTEIGTILEFDEAEGMALAQVQSDRGGTWEDLGTVSRGYSGGSVTVRGFKRIA